MAASTSCFSFPLRSAVIALAVASLSLTACGDITIGAGGEPSSNTLPGASPTTATTPTGGAQASVVATVPADGGQPGDGDPNGTNPTIAPGGSETTAAEQPEDTSPTNPDPGTIDLGDNTPLLPLESVELRQYGSDGVTYDVAVAARYAGGAIELIIPVDPGTFAPTGEAVLAVYEVSAYWTGGQTTVTGSSAGIDVVAPVAIGGETRTVRAQIPSISPEVELLALVTTPGRLGGPIGIGSLPELPQEELRTLLFEVEAQASNPTDFAAIFADNLYQFYVTRGGVEPVTKVMAVHGDGPAVVHVLLTGAADDSANGALYSVDLDPDDSVGWAVIDARVRGLCVRGVSENGLCI